MIHKSYISSLKAKAKIYTRVSKFISRNNFKHISVTDNLIGFTVATLLHAGYDGISQALPFVIELFLEISGIDKLVLSLPLNMTLKRW